MAILLNLVKLGVALRALITACEEYAVSHEMVFNHKKSVILICRSKYMKNVYPVFTLNGKIIDESDTVRYLGHILCNSGKDDQYYHATVPTIVR